MTPAAADLPADLDLPGACRSRRYFSALSIRLEKICSSASRSLVDGGSEPTVISAPALLRLMGQAVGDPLQQRGHVDRLGLELAPALRATASGWR